MYRGLTVCVGPPPALMLTPLVDALVRAAKGSIITAKMCVELSIITTGGRLKTTVFDPRELTRRVAQK